MANPPTKGASRSPPYRRRPDSQGCVGHSHRTTACASGQIWARPAGLTSGCVHSERASNSEERARSLMRAHSCVDTTQGPSPFQMSVVGHGCMRHQSRTRSRLQQLSLDAW
eukprot:12679425-Alexandrium_andersonii.AAC.1